MDINRFILVGNGLDLSLGLKTGYHDFIMWYMKQSIVECLRNGTYNDDILFIRRKHGIGDPQYTIDRVSRMTTPLEIYNYVDKDSLYEFRIKHKFFKRLVEQVDRDGWIDIEKFYYNVLLHEFNLVKGSSTRDLTEIKSMNFCMDGLEKALVKYLKTIQLASIPMDKSFFALKWKDKLDDISHELVYRKRDGINLQGIYVVDFNYTNTASLMIKGKDYHHNQIHGSIIKSDIIFGYGDDTSNEYQELENEDEQEILRKIKSFRYNRNIRYRKLLQQLEHMPYEVFIIGHSCGMSDRTLLNTVFEHDNCLGIHCFHYNGIEEYTDKTISISRHFKDKKKFREKMIPFSPSATIPQFE